MPIGPRADRLTSEDDRAPGAPEEPPSPSDFWGEHSADMHHVLRAPGRTLRDASTAGLGAAPPAPDDQPREQPDVGPSPRQPDVALSPRARVRRWEARGRGRRWSERPDANSVVAARSPTWATGRAVGIVGGVIATVVLIVAAFAGGAGSPQPGSTPFRLPVQDLLRGELSTGQIRLPARLTAVAAQPPSERRGRRRYGRARGARSSSARKPVEVSSAAAPSSSSVGGGGSGASSATGAGAGASASAGSNSAGSSSGSGSAGSASGSGSAGSGSGESGASGAGSSGSGSGSPRSTTGSGTTSSPSGPVGAGAPFGPGHLG